MHIERKAIRIPIKEIPLRWKIDAAVITAILMWCAINGFYILTHHVWF